MADSETTTAASTGRKVFAKKVPPKPATLSPKKAPTTSPNKRPTSPPASAVEVQATKKVFVKKVPPKPGMPAPAASPKPAATTSPAKKAPTTSPDARPKSPPAASGEVTATTKKVFVKKTAGKPGAKPAPKPSDLAESPKKEDEPQPNSATVDADQAKKPEEATATTDKTVDEKRGDDAAAAAAAASADIDGDTTEVKATKKVFGKKTFGKKASESAAADAEKKSDTADSSATPSPNAAAAAAASASSSSSNAPAASAEEPKKDGNDGDVTEVKATKKVFGKKTFGKKAATPDTASAAAENPSETGSAATPADSAPPSPTATAAAAAGGEAKEEQQQQQQDGDVEEVKATKKVFGKKKKTPTNSETGTERNSETASQPEGPPTAADGAAAAAAESKPANVDGQEGDAQQTEQPVVKTKKVFGKRSRPVSADIEDDDDEAPTTATAAASAAEQQQQQQQTPQKQDEPVIEAAKNVLASAAANWDDFYDELCRVVSATTGTAVVAESPGGPRKTGPTAEQASKQLDSLLPPGRSLSWLLVERRNGSDQRVGLVWRAAAAGWVGLLEAVLALAAKEDGSGQLLVRVLTDEASADGTCPLYMAAQNDHVEACQLLVDAAKTAAAAQHSKKLAGAVINHQRRTGATPLFIATQAGHLDVIRLLLEEQADVELANNQRATPLVLACSMDRAPIVESLLQRGANWRDRRTGKPPLAWAGPESRKVLETFLERKRWFARWQQLAAKLRHERENPEKPKTPPLQAALHGLHDAEAMRLQEEAAAEAKQREMLAAMLLSLHRKQTKEFLFMFNAARMEVIEEERVDRRDLSFQFAVHEPADIGAQNARGFDNRKIFAPELQAKPSATKQQPGAAGWGGGGSSGPSKYTDPAAAASPASAARPVVHTSPMTAILMRQRMMLATGTNSQRAAGSSDLGGGGGDASVPAPKSKLIRPSIDSLVETLRKEKEDIAAKRQPSTRFGVAPEPAPVQPPRPGRVHQVLPAPTTPEGAARASELNFSKRHEHQWEARVHRVAQLGGQHAVPQNLYDVSNSGKVDGKARSPLAPPKTGIRKSEW